eukprot:1812627-Rhodomonas_salina.1
MSSIDIAYDHFPLPSYALAMPCPEGAKGDFIMWEGQVVPALSSYAFPTRHFVLGHDSVCIDLQFSYVTWGTEIGYAATR